MMNVIRQPHWRHNRSSLVSVLVLGLVWFGGSSLAQAACAPLKRDPSESCGAGPRSPVKPSPAPQKVAAKAQKASPAVPDTLAGVIMFAIKINPQIAAARARLREAHAGIDVAKANGNYQVDLTYGIGFGGLSTTSEALSADFLSSENLTPALRNEATFSGRQLIYDFGATEKGVIRAVALKTAEEYNLAAQIEDIAMSVSDAYMRVFQAREILKLNHENVIALEKIQELVQVNQSNGNGTIADVKRVEARLVDARSISADAEADLQNATDRFRRLVKSDPGALKPTPVLNDMAPKSAAVAVAMLPRSSVHLLSIDASIRAARLELDAKKASFMPQIVLQTDAAMKAYVGPKDYNNLDARAMVALSYKLLDGGLSDGQTRQIKARIDQEEQRYAFDHDEAEADLRQLFNAIDAARGKAKSLGQGVEASSKARELYVEQFRGGKRTLFELLDIQTAFFNAYRNQILNYFEEQRSVYTVLKTLGVFTQIATRKVSEELITGSINPYVPRQTFPDRLIQ